MIIVALVTAVLAHPLCPHRICRPRIFVVCRARRREWHDRMEPDQPLELHVQFRDGWRRPVAMITAVEVWQRNELLGAFPGAMLEELLTQFLRSAWMQAKVARSLTDPIPGVPLGQAPLAELEQVRKPLAPYSPARREALRQQRKRRKG